MQVPLLDLKQQHAALREELRAAVERVLDSQQFILGEEVRLLEEELAAYTRARHAVGCGSGSDALLLALLALDVREGAEVVTTPFTFFATAGAVARTGARPVFADIEPTEKVRVYDKGVTRNADAVEEEEAYKTLVSYRTGDVWVPKLDPTEALHYVCAEFLDAVRDSRPTRSDGAAGLRVVRLLESAQQSINEGGRWIKL